VQDLREIEAEGEAEAAIDAPLVRPSLLAFFRDRDHTRGHLLVSVLVLALPSILTMTFSLASSRCSS
jgi:hypothetical protein